MLKKNNDFSQPNNTCLSVKSADSNSEKDILYFVATFEKYQATKTICITGGRVPAKYSCSICCISDCIFLEVLLL